MRQIAIDTWHRRDHYLNFKDFDDPFFNVCADVDVTSLKKYSRENKESYFLLSYFAVLQIINQIEEFKYRIRGEEVVLHETISGSCTIMKSDRTFGFGYFDYTTNYKAFKTTAQEEIARIKSGEGEVLDPKYEKDDLIYSSVLPWVSFRSIEHAKRFRKGDSIPKIVMGKTYEVNGKILMPVSVSGHHALMDGLHAGDFFQQYETFISEINWV